MRALWLSWSHFHPADPYKLSDNRAGFRRWVFAWLVPISLKLIVQVSVCPAKLNKSISAASRTKTCDLSFRKLWTSLINNLEKPSIWVGSLCSKRVGCWGDESGSLTMAWSQSKYQSYRILDFMFWNISRSVWTRSWIALVTRKGRSIASLYAETQSWTSIPLEFICSLEFIEIHKRKFGHAGKAILSLFRSRF